MRMLPSPPSLLSLFLETTQYGIENVRKDECKSPGKEKSGWFLTKQKPGFRIPSFRELWDVLLFAIRTSTPVYRVGCLQEMVHSIRSAFSPIT